MTLPKGVPLPKLHLGHQLHSQLLCKTAFHEETLARIGLTKASGDYTAKTKFITEVAANEASGSSGPTMGLEFFSLCRSSQMDVWAEYENYDQLKRMRQAYIVHVLDVLLKERTVVAANDRAVKEEEEHEDLMLNGQKVTLDNVFELAKQEEEDAEESESEHDSEDEEAEAELPTMKLGAEVIPDGDLVSAPDGAHLKQTEDRRDQALVRPKVLILAPFKKMAYEIIEQIVFLCNEGKWKRVSKKKKFMEEFGAEEEAFNDFFRIGISLKASRQPTEKDKLQLKLYEQFYSADIIVASPLAVRMIAGHKVDEKANEPANAVDNDFLASIEFLILDQAEAFVFQNMEHLDEVLKALN